MVIILFLTAGELGDGLGAFGDGVFGEFTGEQQFDCGLDLSGAECSLFVISDQFAGFHGESVKSVTNE